jgi:hypothetical protein
MIGTLEGGKHNDTDQHIVMYLRYVHMNLSWVTHLQS